MLKTTRLIPPPATTVAAGALCAAILLLYATPDAIAAAAGGSGDAIGKNLGNLLRTWAQSLFGGVVALISVVFLLNRRYNDLALFVAAAVLVGGLIFSTTAISNVIKAIWTTIAGA